MEKVISIQCKGAGTISIDDLEHIQGNLKECKEKDMAKLIKSMIKYGFSFPEFVWEHEGHKYILDGNTRVKALRLMRDEGWHVPKIPYALIHADNVELAKKKLLLVNSHYAKITSEGLYEFGHDLPDFKDLVMDLELPDIDVGKFMVEFFDEPVISEEEEPVSGEKGFVLEVSFPSADDMADTKDDLMSRGYIVREK